MQNLFFVVNWKVSSYEFRATNLSLSQPCLLERWKYQASMNGMTLDTPIQKQKRQLLRFSGKVAQNYNNLALTNLTRQMNSPKIRQIYSSHCKTTEVFKFLPKLTDKFLVKTYSEFILGLNFENSSFLRIRYIYNFFFSTFSWGIHFLTLLANGFKNSFDRV